MKKILLTGCNGQLGRAIQKEYGDSVEFIRTDMIEGEGITVLDISDIEAVMTMTKEQRPDVIINCAAYTNVDGCETNEDLAYKANAIGPRNLAIAATEVGAKLVHISTDYVFEGNGNRPYLEFDAPNPVSAYGRTKLAGENFVKEFADKYFILRTNSSKLFRICPKVIAFHNFLHQRLNRLASLSGRGVHRGWLRNPSEACKGGRSHSRFLLWAAYRSPERS